MKRVLPYLLTAIVAALCCTAYWASAGGYDWIDTARRFDWVQIAMPDGGVVEGTVESWRDYENSDQLQVTIDGTTYLTHAANVVLIKNK